MFRLSTCSSLFNMLFTSLLLSIASFALGAADDSTVHLTDWSGWGGNNYNNRWASQNSFISSESIEHLSPHCQIPGPVSATPVTLGDIVYYPTWNGSFIALDYSTCQVLWQINVTAIIEDYAPISAIQSANTVPVSRTSPQIDGNVLYFGTQTHALLVAVSRLTGQTLGIIQINSHPLAILTMSPTFYDGKLFIGSASYEEGATIDPNYKCCSFVGNMVALTFESSSGKFDVNWNISTIPEADIAAGWSGVGIWGSQPSIDSSRGQVFVATGNSYSLPQSIINCQNATRNNTISNSDPCLPPSVLQESVLAIDIEHGTFNWVLHLHSLDAWTFACGIFPGSPKNPSSNCPQQPGPDADFGMAPTFVPGSSSTPYGKDTLIIGQKNGNLYAISAQNGKVSWSTAISPTSPLGGLSWGLAVDDGNIYFTAINALETTWKLQPGGQVLNNSAFGAASLSNGSILWEVAAPPGSISQGPPTIVGDVVLVAVSGFGIAGSRGNGSLLALKKESGAVLGEWGADSTFKGGVAVVGKNILFGTGYYLSQPAVNSAPGGSLHVMQVCG